MHVLPFADDRGLSSLGMPGVTSGFGFFPFPWIENLSDSALQEHDQMFKREMCKPESASLRPSSTTGSSGLGEGTRLSGSGVEVCSTIDSSGPREVARATKLGIGALELTGAASMIQAGLPPSGGGNSETKAANPCSSNFEGISMLTRKQERQVRRNSKKDYRMRRSGEVVGSYPGGQFPGTYIREHLLETSFQACHGDPLSGFLSGIC